MYRVEVVNDGDSIFKARSRDYEFIIDIKGKGITPPDTLLASLASCVGVYIRKYAEGANILLDRFMVTAEAEFSQEPPVGFRAIRVCVDLKGAQLDETKRESLLRFIKNCPVHNTLQGNPVIELRIA